MKNFPLSTPARFAAVLFAAVIVLSGAFTGCNRSADAGARDSGASAAPEVPVYAVNTTTAVQGQIRDYLALSGDIVAGSTVDAYSDVAGKVTRLYVSVGSHVTVGDPIAAVDPSKPGMTYVPGITRAPLSGTVVALPAQVGMTISQSVPVARLTGGSALEIRLYVAERFISKMALSLPCEISLDAFPGETFRGSVSEISPVVDPASRTMEVKVNVDNPGSRLKAGMFAKARIITERKDLIVKIPASALVRRFGETMVYTVETDPQDPAFQIARKKAVVPGILVDGVLEIQQGLAPDEEIIVRGQSFLEDGARVNVIDRLAPLSVE
ncbi:MAG: efflux RND transporter periplasmic adaptor subunit [Spirochaetaceae bacterium]|jgi:multidrug efflux pump subunit AcrA (membrane-fusion protein)|nr:efflux RND transporter periplasmic adaptor subunit [Spirochaetaceae bacterium]